MGNAFSTGEGLDGGRNMAVTEGKRRQRGPNNAARSTADDWQYIEVRGPALLPCAGSTSRQYGHAFTLPPHLQECLTKVLLFDNLDRGARRKVVREMYERPIAAGEILIQEGDTGEPRVNHAQTTGLSCAMMRVLAERVVWRCTALLLHDLSSIAPGLLKG